MRTRGSSPEGGKRWVRLRCGFMLALKEAISILSDQPRGEVHHQRPPRCLCSKIGQFGACRRSRGSPARLCGHCGSRCRVLDQRFSDEPGWVSSRRPSAANRQLSRPRPPPVVSAWLPSLSSSRREVQNTALRPFHFSQSLHRFPPLRHCSHLHHSPRTQSAPNTTLC